ncbi:hypothetical protein NM688_g255 [Phlebia brevispora]|uniref:Uncharacterized protein n=1 Tax=Phlebia brevispora TaxID=194682 RepID=A0ACC1TEV5_9APHY|nr:hypothetical protein NM688_g255 [Phlebia brevispora]
MRLRNVRRRLVLRRLIPPLDPAPANPGASDERPNVANSYILHIAQGPPSHHFGARNAFHGGYFGFPTFAYAPETPQTVIMHSREIIYMSEDRKSAGHQLPSLLDLSLSSVPAAKNGSTHIRGPKASWLYGNIIDFFYQKNVGDIDFKCVDEYGTAWRMALPFGEDVLAVVDSKALQHVMQKGGYGYSKKADTKMGNRLIMGRGVVWAVGDSHVRQRKIMTPAFSPSHIRTFTTMFRNSAAKLAQKWKDDVLAHSDEGQDLAINRWLARITLDIVGEAAFDYDFGALENQNNKVSKAYHNMFSESVLYPPKWDILFKATWKYIPEPILEFVRFIPTREYSRFRKTLDTIEDVSRGLVENKKSALLAGDPKSKDIMSILVKANASEDPNARLSDEEMIAQMATLTLAGHETTANTLSWTLWELAKHPEYQTSMRAEIAAARGKVVARGDTDFVLEDLEALPYCNAVLKETLRYHPAVYHLTRIAVQDDVIPLAYPIHSQTGETITEIPISAGQAVLISICGYNRLPELWGQDAHEWNPMRWINGDANMEKENKVGVYSNLMTFSAGVRSCIGWRFSVIESLTLLVELIENFHFSLPSVKAEIARMPTGLMTPMVRDNLREGVFMPLHVSVVHED